MRQRASQEKKSQIRKKKILAYLTADHARTSQPIIRDNLGNVTTTWYSVNAFTSFPNTYADYPHSYFVAVLQPAEERAPLCRILGEHNRQNFGNILDEYGAFEICYRYVPNLVNNETAGAFFATSVVATEVQNYSLLSKMVQYTDIAEYWFSTNANGAGKTLYVNSLRNTEVYHIRFRVESDGKTKLWQNGKQIDISHTIPAAAFETLRSEEIGYFCPLIGNKVSAFYFGDCAFIAGDAFEITEGDYANYSIRYEDA